LKFILKFFNSWVCHDIKIKKVKYPDLRGIDIEEQTAYFTGRSGK